MSNGGHNWCLLRTFGSRSLARCLPSLGDSSFQVSIRKVEEGASDEDGTVAGDRIESCEYLSATWQATCFSSQDLDSLEVTAYLPLFMSLFFLL